MNKYLDLNLSELRHVCVACICGTRFILDLAKPNLRTPSSCGGCGAAFEVKALQEPLWQLKSVWQMLSGSPSRVTFQVPLDEGKPPDR